MFNNLIRQVLSRISAGMLFIVYSTIHVVEGMNTVAGWFTTGFYILLVYSTDHIKKSVKSDALILTVEEQNWLRWIEIALSFVAVTSVLNGYRMEHLNDPKDVGYWLGGFYTLVLPVALDKVSGFYNKTAPKK